MLIRYIVGSIGFLLVWFVVAVIVGVIMGMIFPPPSGGYIFAGIGLNWQSMPGNNFGIAGWHAIISRISTEKIMYNNFYLLTLRLCASAVNKK